MARNDYVGNQVGLDALVDLWFDTVNQAAHRTDFVVVADIGQGNCNVLFNATGELISYYDLGGAVLSNLFTYPDPMPSFCLGAGTRIILSHWDEDHIESLNLLEHAHHNGFAGLLVLSPDQNTNGLRKSPTPGAVERDVIAATAVHVWPDEYPGPAALLQAGNGDVRVIKATGANLNNRALALRIQRHGVAEHILLVGDIEYHAGTFVHGCDQTCVGLVAGHHGAAVRTAGEVPRPLPGGQALIVYSFGWGNSFCHPMLAGITAYEGRGWTDEHRMDTGGAEQAARYAGPRGNVGLLWPNAPAGPGVPAGVAPVDIDNAAVALLASGVAEIEVFYPGGVPANGHEAAVGAAHQAALESGRPAVAGALLAPAQGGVATLTTTAQAISINVAAELGNAFNVAVAAAGTAADANRRALAAATVDAIMASSARVAQIVTGAVHERLEDLEREALGATVHPSTRSRELLKEADLHSTSRATRAAAIETVTAAMAQRVVAAANAIAAVNVPTVDEVRELAAVAAGEASWAMIGLGTLGRAYAPPKVADHVANTIVIARDDVKAAFAAAAAMVPMVPINAASVAPTSLTNNELAKAVARVAAVGALAAQAAGAAVPDAAAAAVAAGRVAFAAARGAPQIGCHRHPRTCTRGPANPGPCSLSIHYFRGQFPSRIDTFAGNGNAGDQGDGGAATAAELSAPAGLAVGACFDLFIADPATHKVRRVDEVGEMTTVAGTGNGAHAGDAVSDAAVATFLNPSGVAFDRTQNALYIADTGHNRVRRVDLATNEIYTVAGTGTAGHANDGGPASAAEVDSPRGITFVESAGWLLIADTGNHAIRKLDLGSGMLTTVAGTLGAAGTGGDGGPATAATLDSPRAVAVDAARNLYIADTGNHAIRNVNLGIIDTLAGTPGAAGNGGDGGQATAANLDSPEGVAIDDEGNLYIADTGNHCVRIVDLDGDIARYAGRMSNPGANGDGGQALNARLRTPTALWLSDAGDDLFIADRGNQTVRLVDTGSGNISRFAGTVGTAGANGDGGLATAAELDTPRGLVLDAVGTLYIADSGNQSVRSVDTGNMTAVAGHNPGGVIGDGTDQATAADLNGPEDVATDPTRNILYIADTLNHRVRKVDLTTGVITTAAGDGAGAHAGDAGPATAASLHGPRGVVVDTEKRHLYIADTLNHRVRRVDLKHGVITTIAGTGAQNYSLGGVLTLATTADLDTPTGLALDYLSLDFLYIADTGNDCVRRVQLSTGIITTVVNAAHAPGNAGDGAAAVAATLSAPVGLAMDEGGLLYIADTGNHRVRMLNTNDGTLSAAAGSAQGFFGDGGAPTLAQLDGPKGVAVDTASRNLFTADTTNHRCRRVLL